jgi:hypothetical protein
MPPPARARLLALAVVGFLAAGCGEAPTGGTADAVPATPTPDYGVDLDDDQYGLGLHQPQNGPLPCGTKAGLRVSPGLVDTAMGLRVMTLYLTNCGTDPYTVEGHPALSLLDDERQPLDVTVQHGSESIAQIEGFDEPPQPVTLASEESAVASVAWRNTVDDLTVTPVAGAYLDVVPVPDEPAQIVQPHSGIDVGTTGRLGVSAWERYAPQDSPSP